MSQLSYMEKLLDGVEVEWRELGEVCRFINGRAYKQSELLEKGKCYSCKRCVQLLDVGARYVHPGYLKC